MLLATVAGLAGSCGWIDPAPRNQVWRARVDQRENVEERARRQQLREDATSALELEDRHDRLATLQREIEETKAEQRERSKELGEELALLRALEEDLSVAKRRAEAIRAELRAAEPPSAAPSSSPTSPAPTATGPSTRRQR